MPHCLQTSPSLATYRQITDNSNAFYFSFVWFLIIRRGLPYLLNDISQRQDIKRRSTTEEMGRRSSAFALNGFDRSNGFAGVRYVRIWYLQSRGKLVCAWSMMWPWSFLTHLPDSHRGIVVDVTFGKEMKLDPSISVSEVSVPFNYQP